MRLLTGLLAVGTLMMASVTAGSARSNAGGTSIANAPVVPLGQQQFGNLAPMRTDGSGDAWEFWKLNLVTGDRVQIDFEEVSNSSFQYAQVWPIGTTDYTINSKDALFTTAPSANNKGELAFTAPQTGTYPLSFSRYVGCCSPGGGYDFNVVDHHALRLLLAAPAVVSLTGTATVSVRLPDGTAVSDPALKVSLLGIWQRKNHVLGSGKPTNGAARIAFRLPRSLSGLTIRLQAKGEGSAYVTTRSRTVSVRVR